MLEKIELNLPSYPEERAFLKDPTEAAFIADLAFSLESDLAVFDTIVGFEELDLGPNVYVQLAKDFGLEANRFVEMAKRGGYLLKQKAKQLVTYIFKFFLDFLRGSTDVKAVLAKYQKLNEKYLKALEGLRIDQGDKKIKIRDTRTRIFSAIYVITMIVDGLNNLLNLTHELNKDKKIKPEVKVLRFAKGIQVINESISIDEVATFSGDDNKIKVVKKKLLDILKTAFKEDKQLKTAPDAVKPMQEKLEAIKKLYNGDIPEQEVTYKEAYSAIYNGLKSLSVFLEKAQGDEFDFKTIARKIEVVQKEMLASIDEISNEEQLKEDEKSKNVQTAINYIMSVGSYMAKTKDVVAVSLSSFKGDMEVMFTESKKVGTVLYKK